VADTYDAFFSYRRKDLARAQPLLDALEALGVRVWRDQTDLSDNAAITSEIRGALAASKTLLAVHSRDYPLNRPCQQELAVAWIAAQQMGEPPYDRVLVLNPEDGFDHLPEVLREQQSRPRGCPAALARAANYTALGCACRTAELGHLKCHQEQLGWVKMKM
jgi:hypothetical protein